MNDILERMRAGELILETDPDYPALYRLFEETMSLVGELNTGYHTADGVRALLERIWGQPLDASVRMFPPFHTAFGKFTRVGKGVFINFGARSSTAAASPSRTMFSSARACSCSRRTTPRIPKRATTSIRAPSCCGRGRGSVPGR